MDASLFVAVVLILAGVLALELGISTAITEIVAGMLLALLLDVSSMGWLDFLAPFGMLGLMFMAGFEVNPQVFQRRWQASLGIGLVSFLIPLAGVFAASRWLLGTSPVVAGLLGIGLSVLALPRERRRVRAALSAPDPGRPRVPCRARRDPRRGGRVRHRTRAERGRRGARGTGSRPIRAAGRSSARGRRGR